MKQSRAILVLLGLLLVGLTASQLWLGGVEPAARRDRPDKPTVLPAPSLNAGGEAEAPGPPRSSIAPAAGPESDVASAPPAPALDTLRVEVVDPLGLPVRAARVALSYRLQGEHEVLDLRILNRREDVTDGLTGDQGMATFEVPAGCPLEMVVTHPQFAGSGTRSVRAGEEHRVQLTAGCTLEGQVTSATDGKGVAGVRLRAWEYRSHKHRLLDGQTDTDGRFRFTQLPVGTCTFVMDPQDHAAPEWRNLDLQPNGTVTLEIALESGSTVWGTVTDAASGAPISGARVLENWTGSKTVATDQTGEYRLTGLTGPGVADLYVHASGYGSLVRRVHPGERSTDPLRIDFALQPARKALGRVVDDQGEPVADAYVAAVESDFVDMDQVYDWTSTQTASDGSFELISVHPGLPHHLYVHRRGFGFTLLAFPPSEHESPVVEFGDVVLPVAARVEGRVVGPEGHPIQDAKVALKGCNRDIGRFNPSVTGLKPMLVGYVGTRESSTHSSGRFSFADVAPGSYSLVASVPGSASQVELPVEVQEGQWLRDLRIEVNPGRTIQGRVVGPAGEPIAGASVQASFRSTRGWFERAAVTKTLPDGTFLLSGLDAIEYRVRAHPSSTGSVPGREKRVPSKVQLIPAGTDGLVLSITRAAPIVGTVRTPDGSPAANALLFVTDELQCQVDWTVTDDRGHFRLDVVANDPLNIRAHAGIPNPNVYKGASIDPAAGDGAHLEGVRAPITDLVIQLP